MIFAVWLAQSLKYTEKDCISISSKEGKRNSAKGCSLTVIVLIQYVHEQR